MLKFVMVIAVTLGAGILVGVAVAILGPFTGASVNLSSAPSPLPTVGISPPASSTGLQVPLSTARGEVSTQVIEQVATLSTQLDQESANRKRLEEELNELKDNLRLLEQRFDEVAERKSEPDARLPRTGRSRQITPTMFIEAGFRPDEAETLSALWGQQQMELLYLRDQASREGWLNSPRYAQSVRDLRNGAGSMREELGLDTYDRFLFATGQSNRVVLNSVIESSPAQDIGLQPGDTILTYDGNRILSATDLRAAIRAGEPDIPVVIEVERGGQIMEFEIARGPIGVTLGAERVEP